MNKTAIKNFSIRARNKLIEDIKQKAFELGITEKEIKNIETFEGGFQVEGTDIKRTIKYYPAEKVEKIIEEKRNDLVSKIKDKGFEQIIEEVAYTWFNRFIALRFMEVNDYLPTGVRVLSSEEDTVEPDIIKEVLNLDLDIDKEIVYNLQDNNDIDELYKYLLIKQCNKLGEIMPTVFEEIADYTELLLPDNLLAEGSVIRDLVESIDEEDYKNQVEIIGWFYQFYNQEKREVIFDSNMSNRKKIPKFDIPAATQIFTPKWIVKFIVQNSLGKYWLKFHEDSDIAMSWEFFIKDKNEKLNKIDEQNISPEDIKIIDPSMGSGHILVYVFEILYEIYLSQGYSERKIPQLILEKNLYGLEIDDRATQLAIFSVLMKARHKNRRLFRKPIKLNIYSIQESNIITEEMIDYFADGDEQLEKDFKLLVDTFKDAKIYGSILKVDNINFNSIEKRLDEIKNEQTLMYSLGYKNVLLNIVPLLIKQGRIMNKKYEIVVTNPPYMGHGRMNKKLKEYVQDYYSDVKTDLFSIFIKKGIDWTNINGYIGLVTPYVWFFITSYEKLRNYVLDKTSIKSLIQLEYNAFEGATIPVSTFVLNKQTKNTNGEYIKLSDFKGIKTQPLKAIEAIENPNVYYRYSCNQRAFGKIPGSPFAYWVSDQFISNFQDGELLEDKIPVKKGMDTGNNKRFLRYWYEVNYLKVGINLTSGKDTIEFNKKWIPYNKGGGFRKWYGNNEYLLNWENDGSELRNSSANLRSKHLYFKDSITWSALTSSTPSARLSDYGAIFDSAGSSMFPQKNHIKFYLAFMNSKITEKMLKLINPTLNYGSGTVGKLPILSINNVEIKNIIDRLTDECVMICRKDWDSFETSWDFKKHPLLEYKEDVYTIEESFNKWSEFRNKHFNQLRQNEEELNEIFTKIYGLEYELTPEVEEKDITIRKADRERDIKSFISYAVGCMFGRYSLDEEGLVYAGGEFDIDNYKKFKPVEDNVIPITTDDYFEDDIVSRFVEFVKVTFGEETLEENLEYIAETIGKKSNETSRQAIRNYFTKKSGFYKDHVKTYSKTPIYWMFDSGKQDGFKTLVYMHRYDPSLVAKVRTDYLHELQKKYDAEINRLERLIDSDVSAREKSAARKQRDKVSKQLQECKEYDQVIAHVANQRIDIDLDDGVKVNYAKFQKVEVPRGDGKKPLKANLLAKL
ncbi:MAG: BREX-1 system adenine-specific DNA-methyltransferase PglX [Firmicutes bacterium]|nr:BREX-1 system adenine-specific DNA-methyltransferase PglX [Bacillota bacterium]